MEINNRVTTSNNDWTLLVGLHFQPQTLLVTLKRVTETLGETKILVESSGTIQTQSGNFLAAATLNMRTTLRQSDRHDVPPPPLTTAPLSTRSTDLL